MASRDDIDRVRSAVSILDVVAPYVALKRSGPVWKGLCPFHSEKTPSFQVNPDKGFWYCFGQCSTGGDAFKFLERVENLTFPEALERLAQMAGITLANTRESSEAFTQREKLYRALEAATGFYQETLARSPGAKRYLEQRGIAPDTMSTFRLGYAGESYDALAAHLRKSNIAIADAVEAGILTATDRQPGSAPYDKLRGRVICPILDVHDRPIAFGGRLMEDVKDRPKYINTAETPVFSKGKTFFAMSRARKAMGDLGYAVVVEGYFDVISAHQAGFVNVVATLGTALTPDHAEMLQRHVGRVVLAFDADAAGFKAAQRANSIFEAKEFEVLVLDMPPGEDPDSLLRAGRTADFQRAIDNAVPIREFQLRALLAQYQARPNLGERDKAAIFRREIVPLIRGTKSVIERERYIRLAAPLHPFFDEGTALAEDQIRQEVAGGANARQATPGQPQQGGWRRDRPGRDGFGALGSTGPLSAPRNGLQSAEENLLRAMIAEDALLCKMIREAGITAELFVTPAHRELARRLLSTTGTDGSAAAVIAEIATRSDEAGAGTERDNDVEVSAGQAQERDVARLAAWLMALGSGTADEDDSPGSTPPITEEVITDSIYRLRREQDEQQEKLLRARAEEGDVAAAHELMQLLRRIHGK